MKGEIFVVTGSGQGHLHPCMELCRHLTSRNYHTTLVIPSLLSLTIPSSFSDHPLIALAPITGSSAPRMPESLRRQSGQDLEAHLASRPGAVCAIIDFQMGWSKEVFCKFHVPVVSLFTFGACAASMEWGAWKIQAADIKPGEFRPIPGLPEEMSLSHSDLKRKPMGPPRDASNPNPPPPGRGGPPAPGSLPPWVPEIEGSIGLMFNTCDDLERPFLAYMADQMGTPVWGVGPLLPDLYWKSSLIQDRQIREHKRQSNYTEEEVIQWLDSKPRGSVLYVAFGSEVGPTVEEYSQLADALEETTRPFIWVIQSASGMPKPGVEKRVGGRGMIIEGWAPQLLILSHPSTGGFLSHCGWNSTAEAIGLGVPFLAWPIRGDQHCNAKLVVNHLRIGYKVTQDMSKTVMKDDIVDGIERLMGDQDTANRATALRAKFAHGFPASSEAALDRFLDFACNKYEAS